MRIDRIYTRAGDAGQTSLGDGARVSKSDLRIWAYGTVDETGAAIGVAVATGVDAAIADLLGRIQNDLFDVGADLAVPLDTERGHGKSRLRITDVHVTALERACDDLGERLAPLESFVLSGGTPAAAALAYVNRLSDLLFILARVANDDGGADVLWRPGGSLAAP